MNNRNNRLCEIEKLIKKCENSSLASFFYQDSTYTIQFSKVMEEADCNIKTIYKTNMENTKEQKLSHTEFSIDGIAATDISKDERNEKEDIVTITSPFVGTVEFSDQIKSGNHDNYINKGDVLFSVEAMKIYNDVKSPVTGTIVDILVKDCSLVEYEQSIIKIRIDK